MAYADSCGYKIKLLGRCLREPEGKVCAFVAPHLVSCENPLAGVEDVFNAIAVTGNAVGDVMFYGRGAGKLPTASAVVADVIDIARDPKRDRGNQWGPGSEDLVVSSDSLTSRWYVRGQSLHGPGPSGLRRDPAPGPQRRPRSGGRVPHPAHDLSSAHGSSGGGGDLLGVPRTVSVRIEYRAVL